jgi:hypothetical protein
VLLTGFPRLLAIALAAGALLLAACSPEAERTRGEAGADVGNKPSESAAVDLHGKENPDLDVPNLLPPAGQTANQ